MEASQTDINVLHVDDEPQLADLVATFLEREDDRIAVHTALTPKAGLEILNATDIDCIVSDYVMPERNGIDFLQAVREDHPDLPFILYTGKGSEDIASEAISNGVTGYLQKERGSEQYTLLTNRIVNAVSQYWTERYADTINRRYQALFQQSEAAIAWVEFGAGDPIIQDANPAFSKLFCDGVEGIDGEPIDRFVVDVEREAKAEALNQEVQNGEVISREVTRATTDGSQTFHAQIIPIPPPDDCEITNAFVVYSPSNEVLSDSQIGDTASSQS